MKKAFSKLRFRKIFLLVPTAAAFLLLMSFVNSEKEDKTCKNIYVHIDYEHDNYFISNEDVIDLMTRNQEDILINESVENINLKELEARIKTHNFVQDAQVFKDHKGNLTVKVTQCRPIARIIDQNGPHAYIGSNGNCLPSSEKFTARVMLIDGAFCDKLKSAEFLASEEGKTYFDLIKFIDENKFWKAQLAQMTVGRNGDISFATQIGDQIIEFGKPTDVEEKFNKLKIFYKKIYPYKGYNRYKRVSLKFDNQIICE